ncbi:hypothetical protein [Sphingomonas sp. M1-B02]|uniref:hypothetical protein n=1 Tax=Sphingomonas sp. M1-B02 TaxID=3114300 RepID=UPI002240821D|nr:hypothetical protein [Sphingomonas sp. S6-11]UZK67432.1 hypothetical protein OKW87_06260 [Sphingomonas sp. S6-11]
MTFRNHRIAAGLALAFAATGAPAQTPPAPAPTPAPSRTPSVLYLPNVTPERFTLGTPTPAATPTIVPSPTPTPAPSAVPVPRAAQQARRPVVTVQPTPLATASPDAAAEPPPAILPPPTPAPTPAAQPPEPAATPAEATPAWLWMLIGAGAMAALFAAYLAYQRRRGADEGEPEAIEPVAVELPPAPAPAAPSPAPTSAPIASVPAAPEPFEITLRPVRIELGADIILDFELSLSNLQPSAADNVRVTLALMSASPDQDRNIAAFHATPLIDPAVPPFDLPAGQTGGMPVRIGLPRDQLHIVEVGGRPMFVPMVMLDLRWRSGISIRRFGGDFMIGTPGQGSKLGPISLDRGQVVTTLGAARYTPRPS